MTWVNYTANRCRSVLVPWFNVWDDAAILAVIFERNARRVR